MPAALIDGKAAGRNACPTACFSDYGSTPGAAVTVTFTGGLATPFAVTTTGCTPGGTEAGSRTFNCTSPTRPGVTPINWVKAGIPPTVTDTGRNGFGKLASGVPVEGDQPLSKPWDTSPIPVT